MEFDAALTYTSFDQHMHKATTPRQRANLETVVRHSKGEVLADLDMVLPTLSDDPQYHEYGVFANTIEDTGPKGADAVRRNYEAMVGNGSYVIESKKDRVVVSDDEIVTVGTFRQILTAQVARDLGFVGDDAEGFFMLSARTIVLWAFDPEGKAIGEDRFVMNHRIVPIAREDLPALYPAHLLAEAEAQGMTTGTTQHSLEERLDEVESRTRIAALVAGYCEGVDRKNVEKFMSLWHEDGAYLIPGGRGDFYNTDGIRRSQDVIAKAWRDTHHWTTNHVVEFSSPDRATGRSDAFAMCTHHDGRVSYVAATYDDEYERRDGAWKFAKRLVTRWFVSSPVDIELLPPN